MAAGNYKFLGTKLGHIYALTDPRTEEIRYVGRTIQNPKRRLKSHITESTSVSSTNTHKRNWIRQLIGLGLLPEMVILESGDWTNDEINEKEILWISKVKESGARLVNISAGGGGMSSEQARKISRDYYSDPENRVAFKERMRQWAADAKDRGIDFQGTEEAIARRKATKRVWFENGGREILSAARHKVLEDPVKRAKIDASIQSEERRRKISEFGKKRYEDLEERRRTAEAVSKSYTPERRKRVGEAAYQRHGYTSPLSEIICAECGQEFMPRNRSSKLCSIKCRGPWLVKVRAEVRRKRLSADEANE